MVITIEDNKPRKLELIPYEIDIIIEALEYQSHSIYQFFNCDKIVKKLKEVRDKKPLRKNKK